VIVEFFERDGPTRRKGIIKYVIDKALGCVSPRKSATLSSPHEMITSRMVLGATAAAILKHKVKEETVSAHFFYVRSTS
jgi:hypothetical protein